MSKVTILQCDKCKEEIKEKTSYVKATINTKINKMNDKYNVNICNGDYCYECFLKILEENFKFKSIKSE